MSTRTSSTDRRPDVVISYARNTANLARATHKFLRSAGLHVWFDEVSVRSGDHWLAGHYRALTWARHHLILLTDRTSLDWAHATLDFGARCAALNRSLETIPVLREGFDPAPLAERLSRFEVAHLALDKSQLDAQLRALVGRLREHPMRPSTPPGQGHDPYPGLRPHTPDEARTFFGRDREASEAVARLGTQSDGKHRRWLRIAGPPGVGKTAFARAGVVPAVLRGAVQGSPLSWRVATVRLGDQPLASLADGLAETLDDDGESHHVRRDLRKTGLADLVKEQLPADHGLLLVIDHLEDVDGRIIEPGAIARLDALLAEALADFDQRLFLVTAERVDLAEAVEQRLPRTFRMLPTHGALYTLSGLTRDGLKAVVEGPAALVGRPWPPPLSRRLLDDAERQPGGPAALSWMLSALMHAERPSIQAYEQLGTLTEGVSRACDARVSQLSDDDRTRAQGLLCALVDVGRGQGDRPISVTHAEAVRAAGGGPRAEAIVDRLEATGELPAMPLVRVEGPEGKRRVRLAHWALLRLWPGLSAWLEDERPVLERREAAERAAAQWTAEGKDDEKLPRDAVLSHLAGEDLDEARRRRLRAVLSTETRHYLEAAELAELARKEQEEARRDASHRDAMRRVAGERDAARGQAATFRRLVVLLAVLGVLLALWVMRAESTITDLEGQVRSADDRFRAKAAQLVKAEDDKFKADKARGEAEAAQREAERAQRRSDTLRGQAARNAEELMTFALDTWSRGDALMERVPGADGKFVKRLFIRGQIGALEKAVADSEDNPRMRLLLGRQRALLATLSTGRKGRSKRAEHLQAAVDALEPLGRLDRPPAAWLAPLADARYQLGLFLTRDEEGRPAEFADFARGREALDGAAALYARLATEDPERAGAYKLAAAGSKAALARFLGSTGQIGQARTLFGEAITETRAAVTAKPDDAAAGMALALRLAWMGEAETASRAYDAARKAFEDARAALDKVPAGADAEAVERLSRRIRRGLRALP